MSVRWRAKKSAGMILTDAALLFLALISTVYCSVSVYRIRVVDSALWLGALALTLTVTTLMYLPKGKLALGTVYLGVWGWGLWRLWDHLELGGTQIWCDMVNTFARKVPGISEIYPIAKLSVLKWQKLTTIWLLMVGVGFALVLGLLLCRLRRALPVILLTLLPLVPALGVTEAPQVLPMAALMTVWLTLLLTSQAERRDPAGAARLRGVALLIGVLALAGIFHTLPTEGNDTQTPRWAELREEGIDKLSRIDLSEYLAGVGRWNGSGSTRYVSLTGEGSTAAGRTALRIETNVPGKHYLRGWSADIYTGKRWEPLDREAAKELEGLMSDGFQPLMMLDGTIEANLIRRGWPSGPLPGKDTVTEKRDLRWMKVENVAAPGGCVYYPYALSAVPEGARLTDGSHLSRTGRSWVHEITFAPNWEKEMRIPILLGPELLKSYLDTPKEAEVREEYREFVYDHYLQIPEELKGELEEWLERESGSGLWSAWSLDTYIHYFKWFYGEFRTAEDPGDKTLEEVSRMPISQADRERLQPQYAQMIARAVAALLGSTAVYDKNASAPPEGKDYVNYFLRESHRGYCMHFASAGTMLLRTMGIPARYVGGYVVDVPESGRAVVPDSAAHAWVEIYMDGLGWYPCEMTPGFQGMGTGDTTAAEFEADAAPTPRPAYDVGDDDDEDEDDEDEDTASPSVPVPSQAPGGPGEGEGPKQGERLGWGLVLVLGLGAALRGLLLAKRKRELEREDNSAVLRSYACCEKLRFWGGGPDAGLTALANKARFSQHTLTGEERERARQLLREEAGRVYAALPRDRRLLFRLWWGRP